MEITMEITQEDIKRLAHEVAITKKEIRLAPNDSFRTNREGRLQGICIALRLLGIEEQIFKD